VAKRSRSMLEVPETLEIPGLPQLVEDDTAALPLRYQAALPFVDEFNPELTEEGKRLGCWKIATSPYEEPEQILLFDQDQVLRSIHFD